MFRSLSSILLLIGYTVAAFSQQSLSLSDAIQLGLENNYQIRIAKKDLEIATRNNNLGAAGFYPSLVLVASESNLFNTVDDSITFRNFNNRNIGIDLGLELNWVLFKGFRVYITKSQLGLLQDFSAGSESIVVENTIQAIMLAYYRALVENEKLRVLGEIKQLSKDRYKYEKLKKEFGASGSFEELQFKTAYLTDSSNYLLQEILLKNVISELKLLMAADQNQVFNLSDSLTFEAKEFSIEDLRNEMLANNSNLRNQYINSEIYKKEIALQKTNLYPTISGRGGFTQSFNSFKNLDEDKIPIVQSTSLQSSRNYYAIFSLSFNLFNGGNHLRALKNTKVQAEIAQLNIEDARTSLLSQLQFNYDQYLAEEMIVSVSAVNLESAALNLNLAEGRFKNGSLSSLDYRNIQLQYLNVALRKIEAVFNAKQTETELLRLTGGIIQSY